MKRSFFYFLVLLPVMIAATTLLFPWPQFVFFAQAEIDGMQNHSEGNAGKPAQDETTMPAENGQRLVFLLQYIGNDYAGAVEHGTIINEFEYREMLEFAETVIQEYQTAEKAVDETLTRLQRLAQLITDKAEAKTVRTASLKLVAKITREKNLLPFPLTLPDLAAGKALFVANCAPCHGLTGDGRGPSADTLNPKPHDFTNPTHINPLAPYQLYQAVGFGVEGTAMPSFADAFTVQQRWELAFYLLTLRRDFQPAEPQPNERFTLRELATHSNLELAEQLLAKSGLNNNSSQSKAMGIVDYYRQQAPRLTVNEYLTITEKLLRQSLDAFRRGDMASARKLALDGYLQGFEPVEPQIEHYLKIEFESALSHYRRCLNQRVSIARTELYFDGMLNSLGKARSVGRLSSSEGVEKIAGVVTGFYFLQSLTILLREGVEAALLIALLLAFAASANQSWMRSYILGGAIGGLAAGGLTWLAAKYLINISTLGREALEGITSLLAAVVLFTVCLWLIHNADVRYWKNLIHRHAERSLGTGGKWALAFAAFLVVYREAFETVLFYKALWMRTGSDHSGIVLGFGLGVIGLAAIWLLLLRFGAKLPIKPFFAVTSVLLALLTFTFAGYGVRALQIIGWVPETILPWHLRLPLLEIYPTLEGGALQLGIAMSLILGYVVLWYENRRVAREVEEFQT